MAADASRHAADPPGGPAGALRWVLSRPKPGIAAVPLPLTYGSLIFMIASRQGSRRPYGRTEGGKSRPPGRGAAELVEHPCLPLPQHGVARRGLRSRSCRPGVGWTRPHRRGHGFGRGGQALAGANGLCRCETRTPPTSPIDAGRGPAALRPAGGRDARARPDTRLAAVATADWYGVRCGPSPRPVCGATR